MPPKKGPPKKKRGARVQGGKTKTKTKTVAAKKTKAKTKKKKKPVKKNAAAKGKAKATKKPPAKPTYKMMILSALHALNDPTGSSALAIEKYILSQRHAGVEFQRWRLRGAIKKLMASYDIIAHPKHERSYCIPNERQQKSMSVKKQAKQFRWVALAVHSGSGCVPEHSIHHTVMDLWWFNDRSLYAYGGAPMNVSQHTGYGDLQEFPVISLAEAKTFVKPLLKLMRGKAEKLEEKVTRMMKRYANKLMKYEKSIYYEKKHFPKPDPSKETKHNLDLVLLEGGDARMHLVLKIGDGDKLRNWIKAYEKKAYKGERATYENERWNMSDDGLHSQLYSREYCKAHEKDVLFRLEMERR